MMNKIKKFTNYCMKMKICENDCNFLRNTLEKTQIMSCKDL